MTQRPPLVTWRVILVTLAGPIAWLLTLLANLILNPVACTTSRAPIFIVDAVTLAVSLWAAYVGYQETSDESTRRFIGLFAVMMNLLAAAVIAFTIVPVGFLDACAAR